MNIDSSIEQGREYFNDYLKQGQNKELISKSLLDFKTLIFSLTEPDPEYRDIRIQLVTFNICTGNSDKDEKIALFIKTKLQKDNSRCNRFIEKVCNSTLESSSVRLKNKHDKLAKKRELNKIRAGQSWLITGNKPEISEPTITAPDGSKENTTKNSPQSNARFSRLIPNNDLKRDPIPQPINETTKKAEKSEKPLIIKPLFNASILQPITEVPNSFNKDVKEAEKPVQSPKTAELENTKQQDLIIFLLQKDEILNLANQVIGLITNHSNTQNKKGALEDLAILKEKLEQDIEAFLTINFDGCRSHYFCFGLQDPVLLQLHQELSKKVNQLQEFATNSARHYTFSHQIIELNEKPTREVKQPNTVTAGAGASIVRSSSSSSTNTILPTLNTPASVLSAPNVTTPNPASTSNPVAPNLPAPSVTTPNPVLPTTVAAPAVSVSLPPELPIKSLSDNEILAKFLEKKEIIFSHIETLKTIISRHYDARDLIILNSRLEEYKGCFNNLSQFKDFSYERDGLHISINNAKVDELSIECAKLDKEWKEIKELLSGISSTSLKKIEDFLKPVETLNIIKPFRSEPKKKKSLWSRFVTWWKNLCAKIFKRTKKV